MVACGESESRTLLRVRVVKIPFTWSSSE